MTDATNKNGMGMIENGIIPQINKHSNSVDHSLRMGFSHYTTMVFRRLCALRWPDMLTLLSLLCVSFAVYCSFTGFLGIAYILIILQFLLEYVNGNLSIAIGRGVLGVNLDRSIEVMAVVSSVVFGWFVGVSGQAMLIAGFLNIAAVSIRLVYGTARPPKSLTVAPTVLSAAVVSTITVLGYMFAPDHLVWFVIFYYLSAFVLILDLRLKKI